MGSMGDNDAKCLQSCLIYNKHAINTAFMIIVSSPTSRQKRKVNSVGEETEQTLYLHQPFTSVQLNFYFTPVDGKFKGPAMAALSCRQRTGQSLCC